MLARSPLPKEDRAHGWSTCTELSGARARDTLAGCGCRVTDSTERKLHTCAAKLARRRRVCLLEAAEELGHAVPINAYAGVTTPDMDALPPGCARLWIVHSYSHDHLQLVGVEHAVGHLQTANVHPIQRSHKRLCVQQQIPTSPSSVNLTAFASKLANTCSTATRHEKTPRFV